jgi:hypothetical protein
MGEMIARAAQRQVQAPKEAAGGVDKKCTATEVGRLVREAKERTDPFVVVDKMGEIVEARGISSESKLAALLEVIESRKDNNLIAIGGLHNLRLISSESSRDFARELLAERPSDDREMVHSSAIAHIVTPEGIEKRDLELVAELLRYPFPEVRSMCLRALRRIEPKAREPLVASLLESSSEKTKELRIFLQTLPERPILSDDPAKPRNNASWSAERKSAASSVALARAKREREAAKAQERTEKLGKVAADNKVEKQGTTSNSVPEVLPFAKVPSPDRDAVPNRAEVLVEVDSIAVFQASRKRELRHISLDALRSGANSSVASAEDVMANLAEIVVSYGAATAADSMGRLVYLLSDPNVLTKEGVQSFVSALVREANRSQRASGNPNFLRA